MEIDTHDEGTVQGEATNMLWRGDIGYRQPGAMEVKWNSDTGGAADGGDRDVGTVEEGRRRSVS